MSYDSKCFQLAEAFMSDHPKMQHREQRTKDLAQAIQDAIDSEIESFEHEDEGARYRAMYDAEKANAPHIRDREYVERVIEAADMERKRLREEG